jgi:hypothetical protein
MLFKKQFVGNKLQWRLSAHERRPSVVAEVLLQFSRDVTSMAVTLDSQIGGDAGITDCV